jgi:hypothetical protein
MDHVRRIGMNEAQWLRELRRAGCGWDLRVRRQTDDSAGVAKAHSSGSGSDTRNGDVPRGQTTCPRPKAGLLDSKRALILRGQPKNDCDGRLCVLLR